MTIFVAGATGAIGQRLIPLLVAGGHRVIGTTRTSSKIDQLRAKGAEPVIVDGLDREAVLECVLSAKPDVIVHQMSALASMRSFKRFDDEFALTNRLRTEGTEYLLAAAHAAGARKFVAQSYSGWPSAREGGPVTTEADPFDAAPPKTMSKTLAAIRKLENLVVHASGMIGTVLRYGSFYGPGTSVAQDGEVIQLIRQRKFPLIGSGAGIWSFIHIDDAASATRLAIERDAPGVYNIVDDEPAPVATWLPELASAVGAKAPYHLPAWLGQLIAGSAGLSIMTKVRGSSNAKAKSELGWRPRYTSWRDGFRYGLSTGAGQAA
jgi:nucleoside-diphosphate-sugar epimerase